MELHGVGKKGVGFFKYLGRKLGAGAAATSATSRPPTTPPSIVEPLIAAFAAGTARERGPGAGPVPQRARRPRRRRCGSCRSSRRPNARRRDGATVATTSWRPSADAILEQLLPLYVRNAVYRGLVETAAAEHGARRTAMKNATDNAGEILELLKRTYNRQRQAQITQEIAEIVGGAAALQG